METTSDVVTDAQASKAVDFMGELSRTRLRQLAVSESQVVAAAVLHDSVGAASKHVINDIVAKTSPISAEVLALYLRNPSNFPLIVDAVMHVTAPAAREASLLTIRTRTRDNGLKEAELKALAVLEEKYLAAADKLKDLLAASAAKMTPDGIPESFSTEQQQQLEEESEKLAPGIGEIVLTPQLRRDVQKAASLAVEELARKSGPGDAEEVGLQASRAAAVRAFKQSVATFLQAEVQRRSARTTRERFKDAVDKPQQEYFDEAMQIAREVLETTISEVLVTGSDYEVDMNKLLELSAAASTSVARDMCEPYQEATPPQEPEETNSNIKTIVWIQAVVGIALIWFFVLGGATQMKPWLKTVLPHAAFSILYPEPPGASGDIDNILNDHTGTDTASDSSKDPTGDEAVKDPFDEPTPTKTDTSAPDKTEAPAGDAAPADKPAEAKPEATDTPAEKAGSTSEPSTQPADKPATGNE